jgi:cytoskeletal protein CcmA (bactofilin family)
MREERGEIEGRQSIADAFTLWGAIRGDVLARQGAKLYVRGTIHGDLTVADGGRVHVYGTVTGNLVARAGAKVILSGLVRGDVVNDWGRIYIDLLGKVEGNVTGDGETTWSKGPPDA